MNRRDLLKTISSMGAMVPFSLRLLNRNGTEGEMQSYMLEKGPFYLFVLNPQNCCNPEDFHEALRGSGIQGGIVFARDGDLDNFCRIYKFEE